MRCCGCDVAAGRIRDGLRECSCVQRSDLTCNGVGGMGLG